MVTGREAALAWCPGCTSESRSFPPSFALFRGLTKTYSRRGRSLASSPTTKTGSPFRHFTFR